MYLTNYVYPSEALNTAGEVTFILPHGTHDNHHESCNYD
jgi:hypothetical protein